MKPLGTKSAAENGLTTPKSAFGKPISQCELSTKSLKPRGTYHTRENILSASKSAFEPTNSPSGVATKTDSRLPRSVSTKEQKTLGQLPNFGLKTAENEFGPTTTIL
ncbi:hypothetical protein HJ090_28855 [Vibrio parahaemolyticus]|nr:hypothetical protein [Vibrio parahaemolyticus]ELI5396695.1 hypothetical protein [Vibrio parahaemolyticus]MBE4205878.1 hypothetical protein [Vibrio parahaemolyticus]